MFAESVLARRYRFMHRALRRTHARTHCNAGRIVGVAGAVGAAVMVAVLVVAGMARGWFVTALSPNLLITRGPAGSAQASH